MVSVLPTCIHLPKFPLLCKTNISRSLCHGRASMLNSRKCRIRLPVNVVGTNSFDSNYLEQQQQQQQQQQPRTLFPGGFKRPEIKVPTVVLQLKSDEVLRREGVLDSIDAAVSKWVGIVVLNDADGSGGRLYEAARLLKSVIRDRAYLLIAERVDIAAAVSASGVLLSDQGLPAIVARNMMMQSKSDSVVLPLVARNVQTANTALSASSFEGADFLIYDTGKEIYDEVLVNPVFQNVKIPVFTSSALLGWEPPFTEEASKLLKSGGSGLVISLEDMKMFSGDVLSKLFNSINVINKRTQDEPRSSNTPEKADFTKDLTGKEGYAGFFKLEDREKQFIETERVVLKEAIATIRKAAPLMEEVSLLADAFCQLDEPFLLVIVGEFNSGKSTVINALLGGRYLKEGVVPTTNEITLLCYSELDSYEQERCERRPDGQFICYLPAPILKQQMNLVDTPGTNVILQRQQRLTEEFVPRADLILFVISADRPLTQSELFRMEEPFKVEVSLLDILRRTFAACYLPCPRFTINTVGNKFYAVVTVTAWGDVRSFYGDTIDTPDASVEMAARVAIQYLQSFLRINIRDANFNAMKEYQCICLEREAELQEVAFLHYIQQWKKKVVFVLNKSDIYRTTSELEEAIAFIKENTGKLLNAENVTLYPVSARSALEAKLLASASAGKDYEELLWGNPHWRTSCFDDLEKFLYSFLDGSTNNGMERMKLKLETPIRIADRLLSACEVLVREDCKSANQDLTLVNEMVNSVKRYAAKMESESLSWRRQTLSLINNAKGRALKLVGSTLQLSNLDLVASYVFKGEKLGSMPATSSIQNEIISPALSDAQKLLGEYLIWLQSSNVREGRLYKESFEKRWPEFVYPHNEVQLEAYELLKKGEELSLKVIEDFNASAAAKLFEQEIREVVLGTFGGLGAAGLSASLLTSVLPTTLEDLLALGLCSAGGLLAISNFPTRRREMEDKVKRAADILAREVKEAMQRDLLKTIEDLENFVKLISKPYQDAAQSRLDKILEIQEELLNVEKRLQTLQIEIQNLHVS